MQVNPDPSLTTYQSPHVGTISEKVTGGMTGMPDILPPQQGFDNPEVLHAAIKTHFKTRGQNVTDEEVSSIIQNNMGRPGRLDNMIDPELVAGQAASRLAGEAQGTFQYQDPQQRIQDVTTLGVTNEGAKRRRNLVRGEQTAEILGRGFGMSPETNTSVGAGVMSAADTASLGAYAYTRGAIAPDTRGMESQVAAAHPGATAIGQVAGALVPGTAGAKGGAAAAQLIARGRTVSQGAGLVGGLVGNFAGMMPGTAIQTYNAGGTADQAEAAAKHVFTQYGDIAGKVATGEELSYDDWVALGMLIPSGVEGLKALREGRPPPPPQVVAQELARALNKDIGKTPTTGNQVEPAYRSITSAFETKDPAVKITTEPTSGLPDFGPLRLEQIQTELQNRGLPRDQQVALGNEGVSIQARLQDRMPPPPPMDISPSYGGRSYADITDPAKMPPRPVGAEPSRVGEARLAPEEQKIVDTAKQRLLDMSAEERANVIAQAEKSPHPNARFFLKAAQDLESQRFTERSGQKIDVETEQSKYSKVGKNTKFRPDSFVHTTTLDVGRLEKLASEGLQAGTDEGATGFDTGTFAEKANAEGKIGRYWGRDGVPVYIEMPDTVEGFQSKGGDYEVISKGKSYVSPDDLSKARVRVGNDPNVYTLKEAIERAKANEPKPAAKTGSKKAAPAVEPAVEKIREHLKKNPEAGPRELQRELGLSYGTAHRALKRLRAEEPAPVGAETPTTTTPEPVKGGPELFPDSRADLERRIEEKKRAGMSHQDAFKAAQEDLTAEANKRLDTEGAILVDEYGDQYKVNHERTVKGGPKNKRTLSKLTEDGVPYGSTNEQPWISPEESLRLARSLRTQSEVSGRTNKATSEPEPTVDLGVHQATIDNAETAKHKDIKAALDILGLDTKGTTKVLRQRLIEAREASKPSEGTTTEVAPPQQASVEKPGKGEDFIQEDSAPEPPPPPKKAEATKSTISTKDVPLARRGELDASAKKLFSTGRKNGDFAWFVSDLAEPEKKYLLERFGGHTEIGKAIRERIQLDAEADSEAGGSEVGSPIMAPRNTDPGSAVNPMRAQAANARQARSMTDPESPHKIISRLLKKMNLGPAGFGGANILKKWAGGFIHIQPEAVRLRMADGLGTTIHEVGHYLQKLIFQGGVTELDRTPRGERLSSTGLAHDAFPKHWDPELQAMGEALYGKRVPAAGYVNEGWAELIRNAFTGDLDRVYDVGGKMTKVRDMRSYQEAIGALQTRFPEQYAALTEFRDAYEKFRASSARARLSTYIQRENEKSIRSLIEDPIPDFAEKVTQRVNDFINDARTAWFDRMRSLVMLKEDVGLKDIPAAYDPEIVARRAMGRAGGDLRNALERGTFIPTAPEHGFIGKSLRDILMPVSKNLDDFNDYLFARRVIERRAKGFKGLAPEISNADVKAVVAELDAKYPEFKKAASEFYGFGDWTLEYARAHGLLTDQQVQLIENRSDEYVTLRAIYDEASGRETPAGAQKRYSDTGSGVRRFSRNNLGRQFVPPIEAFITHMQGIFERAQNNRVGQTLVGLFAGDANYYTMPRWRLDETAIKNGIDPEGMPRQDVIDQLNIIGKRVSISEGMGRWIDRIDTPLTADKISGPEAEAIMRKRLKAAGIDPDDPAIQALTQLLAKDDFLAFRPSGKPDAKSKQFTVLINGKPTFWEAKNDRLFRFIKGFENPSAVQGFMTYLTLGKRVLRAGATTYNPAFPLSNFLRDTVESLVSGTPDPTMFKRGVEAVKHYYSAKSAAYWKAFTSGDPGAMFLASGADMKGIFQEYYDPQTKRFDFENLFHKHKLIDIRGETAIQKALDVATTKPIWRAIQSVNERFELATRMAEFEGNLAARDVELAADLTGRQKPTAKDIAAAKSWRNRSDYEAAGQAASDVTLDFMRGGRYALEVNKVIPFFNAALQGGAKLGRYIKNNPGRFVAQTFKWVIMPSIIQHMLVRHDKNYWNLPQEQRDRYWHFPIGNFAGDGFDRYLRIPKPYALGSFALLAERQMASMDGMDPSTGERGVRDAWKGTGGSIWQSFRPPITVPLITEALELYTNKSFYTGAEIVRQGEKIGEPGQQGGERSSEFARTMGGLMNIPPPQIDYAIQGTFGGAGTNATQFMIDPMLKVVRGDMLGYEERPTTKPKNSQMDGWPIIKAFIVSEPKTYSENLNRFTETFKEAETIFRGVKSAERSADGGEEYYKRNQAQIDAYHTLVKYKRHIDKAFSELRDVYRDTKMTEDDRNKQTKEIYGRINGLASDGMRDIYSMKDESK